MLWKETRILRRRNGPFYDALLHGSICYFCSCKCYFHKRNKEHREESSTVTCCFSPMSDAENISWNLGHSPCTKQVLFSLLSWIFSKGSLVLFPFSLTLKVGCSQGAISSLPFCSSLYNLMALGLFISPSWPAQFFINPSPHTICLTPSNVYSGVSCLTWHDYFLRQINLTAKDCWCLAS